MDKVSVFDILRLLDENDAWYELQRYCDDTIDINVTFPGLRLEISCHSSGEMGYSVFRGDEDVSSNFVELKKIIASGGDFEKNEGASGNN